MSEPSTGAFDLEAIDVAEIWSLVGLAVVGLRASDPWEIRASAATRAARFAHAVGLDDVLEGHPHRRGEPGRTYCIRRIKRGDNLERIALDIAALLASAEEEEERQKSVRFALVELMRNALQHSADPLGGLVAAQRMDAGHRGYPHASLQIAVGDSGIGVLEALSRTHRDLTTQEEALWRAIQPHVSGTFEPSARGGLENAGMGLFMVAEMAKLTAGRMLLASRGAALALGGELDEQGELHTTAEMIKPPGTGFPGTLVAFELPLDQGNHAGLIEAIIRKRDERAPTGTKAPWLKFEPAPSGTATFLVKQLAEDVTRAQEYSRKHVQPRIFDRHPVAFDFRDVSVCTQSFAHALLFELVRLSWALQVPIYIEHADPAVVAVIRLVDDYARSA